MKNAIVRKAIILGGALYFVIIPLAAQKTESWNLFAKTKFESKYNEKIGEYVFYPKFSPDLTALAGKEIVIDGFYVPFAPEEGHYIILSKFPMSNCYFCGGGGPESIAEVTFKDKRTKFQVDDFITIKGKLRLNVDDLDHLNFLIDDAVMVKN